MTLHISSKSITSIVFYQGHLETEFREEYFGLKILLVWVIISKKEYNKVKHNTERALPTMDVLTIQFDKRSRYQIVILGNLDRHNWMKSNTYVPVMLLIDLHLMTILACHPL